MALVKVQAQSRAVYESGFLDFAMLTGFNAGSWSAWKEAVIPMPTGSFVNTENFTKFGDEIYYMDEEETFKKQITMHLELDNGDVVYHSLGHGNSWFFSEVDDVLEALYVD